MKQRFSRQKITITLVAIVTLLPYQQGMWLMPIITRILPGKYDINRTQDIEVIEASL